jgi:hypothetical protein
MRADRVRVSTAFLLLLGSVAAIPAAHATDAATLYVGTSWPSATCSDTAATAGSQSTPFCTIQAAVDKVQPGETILASPGGYAPFTVSTSGTPTAPITITSAHLLNNTLYSSDVEGSEASPAITISGAHYVNLSGFSADTSTGSDLVVTGSSHVDIGRSEFDNSSTADAQPLMHVTGGSSSVTIERDVAYGYGSAPLLAVDGGGSGDVITTDYLEYNLSGPGLVIDGMPDIDVTSNTVYTACGASVQIRDGSTATIENNVLNWQSETAWSQDCTLPATSIVGLDVDGSSAVASTVDYNIVNDSGAGTGAVNYSWAGNTYATSAAFTAATGQGQHDTSSAGALNPAAEAGFTSTALDSANADAPGELPTDVDGYARVDDPIVPNTGAGAATYYDRGAIEVQQHPDFATLTLLDPDGRYGAAPVGGTVTFSGLVRDGWSGALTCSIDFGDGNGTELAAGGPLGGRCATTHQYAATGSYMSKLTTVFSDGTTKTVSVRISITAAAPLVPSLSLTPDSSTGVTAQCAATSGWGIDSYTIDFGDGTAATSSCGHHEYQWPGTYPVTMTVTDAGKNTASTAKSFTTVGDFYTPVSPTRILDTRSGLGTATGTAAKVPANGTVRLKVAGTGPLPATGIDAVALNVTVANPGAGGYITVYPDGIAKPTVSNLNFTAGQAIPNTVIVKVSADGYIDLTNGSGGTVNLVADVQGYYGMDGSSGFRTVTPTRLLDTRASKSTIAANGTAKVYFGSYTGATAVTVNLTAVNAKQGGYLTAYPDGSSIPKASNVNFAAGQITQNEAIVKVGADGYVDITNTSAGTVDLIVDLTGYFTADAGMGFVPIDPTRVLDTRKTFPSAVQPSFGASVFLDGGSPPFIPGNPNAVAANVTVTGPTAGGYIMVCPGYAACGKTSTLNFSPGQTIANAAMVGVNANSFYMDNDSGGTVNLITDIFGFYN